MNDEALRDLARRAGIAVEWHDYANRPHDVAPDALRRILAALGLPADTRGDLAASRRAARQARHPDSTCRRWSPPPRGGRRGSISAPPIRVRRKLMLEQARPAT